MRTVILSGVSKRGIQIIRLHGNRWELVKEENGRFLLRSSGATFHIGDGIMEPDWRFVQVHLDRDFHIELGKGQATIPQFASLSYKTEKQLIRDLNQESEGLNLTLHALKGGKKTC